MSLQMSHRSRYCLLVLVASILLFREPLTALFSLAGSNEQYSHTLFAPFLCAGFLYWHRARIFSQPAYSLRLGAPLLGLGVFIYLMSNAWSPPMDRGNVPTVAISGFVLVSTAAFILFYGRHSFMAAQFPFALFLLFIPLPQSLVHSAVTALQRASADWTYALFHLISMPVLRDGMMFMLPGVTIEVAEECSGIRASTALLITSVILSRLFLRSTWAKVLLVLLAIPIAVLKNAVRIATISWLGVYVSPEYLNGSLHHSGGPLFSLFALGILIPLLLGLQRGEAAVQKRRAPLLTASPTAET